ncbi:MAG: diiron oxygenase, partial [Gammaproteobacteria bacterium]|nr:diiron oxygenase [Gammaproteobacteria bacterium]
MSGTSTGLIEQLTRNSAPYHDPLTRIDWESLDRRAFWLPEPALSLYGLPQYVALGEAQRQTLSQYEFINFLMAGLWLEGLFMHRISATLLEPVGNLTRHIYHLHELREETGHSLMFLELMRRAHLPLHEPRFWRLGLVNALGRYAPFESVLFWVAVLIGEEVPDRLNRYVRNHRD